MWNGRKAEYYQVKDGRLKTLLRRKEESETPKHIQQHFPVAQRIAAFDQQPVETEERVIFASDPVRCREEAEIQVGLQHTEADSKKFRPTQSPEETHEIAIPNGDKVRNIQSEGAEDHQTMML